MSDYIDLNKARFHAKFNDFKATCKEKATKAVQWCADNPKAVVAIASAAGILFKIAKGRYEIFKEDDLRFHRIYDHSTGHYWHIKPKLTNDILLEIDARRKMGQSLAQALRDMGILA